MSCVIIILRVNISHNTSVPLNTVTLIVTLSTVSIYTWQSPITNCSPSLGMCVEKTSRSNYCSEISSFFRLLLVRDVIIITVSGNKFLYNGLV